MDANGSTPLTRRDLVEILGSFSDRLDGKFDDIDAKFNAMDAKFNAMDAKFNAMDAKIDSVEARLSDRLERAVTTLLTGFHVHARRANVRDTALETRVAQIEDRLLDIEQQIAKPPAA